MVFAFRDLHLRPVHGLPDESSRPRPQVKALVGKPPVAPRATQRRELFDQAGEQTHAPRSRRDRKLI